MNSRFYIKINPKFQFSKISLNKQTGFNSDMNLKKILYHYDDKNIIKKFNFESLKVKNNDKQMKSILSKYKNGLNQSNNNKYVDNLTSISNEKKINDINSLRSKLLRNNNKLKSIDFNVNNNINKDHDFKLNINHYLSERKIKNIISRNEASQNKIQNYLSENTKNSYDISLNNNMNDLKINKSHCLKNSNKLYLPYIPTNIIRKSNNMRSFLRKIEFNKNYEHLNKERSNETIKQITIYNGKKNEKDIFKNINYFIDNKKSKIKVNDIQRNKNIINDNDYFQKFFFIKRKSSIMKDKLNNINKNDNDINKDGEINNQEAKNVESDRYMIYENSKKYIDTDKIYNSRKFCLANIPNVSLDKEVLNVKYFESNVKNIKDSQLDLPICIKLTK